MFLQARTKRLPRARLQYHASVPFFMGCAMTAFQLLQKYPNITVRGAALALGCTPRTAARELESARRWRERSLSERLECGHELTKTAAHAVGCEFRTVIDPCGIPHASMLAMDKEERSRLPLRTYIDRKNPLARDDQ